MQFLYCWFTIDNFFLGLSPGSEACHGRVVAGRPKNLLSSGSSSSPSRSFSALSTIASRSIPHYTLEICMRTCASRYERRFSRRTPPGSPGLIGNGSLRFRPHTRHKTERVNRSAEGFGSIYEVVTPAVGSWICISGIRPELATAPHH